MGVQVIGIPGVIDSTRTTVVPVGLVYTLWIENVNETVDGGVYQCCVATSGSQCGDTSPPANFTVLAIGPKCVLESDNVIEGQNTSMLCQSKNGDPLKTLSWYVQEFGTVESIFWTDSQYAYRRLFWTPTRNDTGMEFDCTMSQDGIVEDKCTLGPFDIKYPPTVEIIPRKPTVTAFQDTITFHCNVNANPPVNTLLWLYDDDLIVDGASEPGRFSVNGHIFQVSSFTDSDDGAIVKCTVFNGVGYNTAEVNITVNILPTTASRDTPIPALAATTRAPAQPSSSSHLQSSTGEPQGTARSDEAKDNTVVYIVIGVLVSSMVFCVIFAVLVIALMRAKRAKRKQQYEESDSLDVNVFYKERSIDNPIAGFDETEFEMTEKPNGYFPHSMYVPGTDATGNKSIENDYSERKSFEKNIDESEHSDEENIRNSEESPQNAKRFPSESSSMQPQEDITSKEKAEANQYDTLSNATTGENKTNDELPQKNVEGLLYADLLLTPSDNNEIRKSQALDSDVTYAEIQIKK
ncbi:uncharacterized protein LOC144350269 [Saccoglossus kowalevskii]